MDITTRLIQKTHRVPTRSNNPGNGISIARQLDVVLIKAGFKLSTDLLAYLSQQDPEALIEEAGTILTAVKELVGDHVNHNVYFRDFPKNIPNTEEFWLDCIKDALAKPESAEIVQLELAFGVINLLDLPKYGTYLHTYEEMLAAHEALIPSIKDRLTLLHRGKGIEEEAQALYLSLAESRVPLNDSDRELLRVLAIMCLNNPQPEVIPVREHKALINQVRLINRKPLIVDTVTDVLRLACALSEGDVTLVKRTKFISFSRRLRHGIMEALEEVVSKSEAKLADVNQYQEMWKRLGERLHPHEFKNLPYAQEVFMVARKERRVLSFASRVAAALKANELTKAVQLMENAPGMLMRNLDQIIRKTPESDIETILQTVEKVLEKVSARVMLSLREHLQNRVAENQTRIFANKKGKAWVTKETRVALNNEVVGKINALIDAEVSKRLPSVEQLVIDQRVLNLALSLSEKTTSSGFGIMPRGSVFTLEGEVLRFFVYWKEKQERTDYDLSMILLDENFKEIDTVSYRHIKSEDDFVVHSGDITSAPNGATEMIDVNLKSVQCTYIIPEVNVFAGEGFNEIESSFFGFMEQTAEQKGKPFEAATARMKSDLQGKGQVALPLVFMKDKDGKWSGKWLHLYLNGKPRFNQIENNRMSVMILTETLVKREFLTLTYLTELMSRKAKTVLQYTEEMEFTEPITFIGLELPEHLPEHTVGYTLKNLYELIPA